MQIHTARAFGLYVAFWNSSPAFVFIFWPTKMCFVGILPYQTLLEINWPIVGAEGSSYHLEMGIIMDYNEVDLETQTEMHSWQLCCNSAWRQGYKLDNLRRFPVTP